MNNIDNYMNRSESSNKGNNISLSSKIFFSPNKINGRNLSKDFEKIVIKKQNKIMPNKIDYLEDNNQAQLNNIRSCSLTHCNKYYFDFTDFQKKKSENVFSDKNVENEEECMKIGCKKYCEDYKNWKKCYSECKCVKCENREINKKKIEFNELKCCLELGIYVIENKIHEQKFTNKKRKRDENKKTENLEDEEEKNSIILKESGNDGSKLFDDRNKIKNSLLEEL